MHARACENGIRIKAAAQIDSYEEDIRCIKVTIHGIAEGETD